MELDHEWDTEHPCGSQSLLMPMHWTVECGRSEGHEGHHWDPHSGFVWPRPIVSMRLDRTNQDGTPEREAKRLRDLMEPKKTTAAQWHQTVETEARTLFEFIAKWAEADQRENGHECGHLFTIRATNRGHFMVTGSDDPHLDADWGDDMPFMIQVRANSLRDALLKAASHPLPEWERDGWGDEDEGGDDGD